MSDKKCRPLEFCIHLHNARFIKAGHYVIKLAMKHRQNKENKGVMLSRSGGPFVCEDTANTGIIKQHECQTMVQLCDKTFTFYLPIGYIDLSACACQHACLKIEAFEVLKDQNCGLSNICKKVAGNTFALFPRPGVLVNTDASPGDDIYCQSDVITLKSPRRNVQGCRFGHIKYTARLTPVDYCKRDQTTARLPIIAAKRKNRRGQCASPEVPKNIQSKKPATVFICNEDNCYPVPCVPQCSLSNKYAKIPNGVMVCDGDKCHMVDNIPCEDLCIPSPDDTCQRSCDAKQPACFPICQPPGDSKQPKKQPACFPICPTPGDLKMNELAAESRMGGQRGAKSCEPPCGQPKSKCFPICPPTGEAKMNELAAGHHPYGQGGAKSCESLCGQPKSKCFPICPPPGDRKQRQVEMKEPQKACAPEPNLKPRTPSGPPAYWKIVSKSHDKNHPPKPSSAKLGPPVSFPGQGQRKSSAGKQCQKNNMVCLPADKSSGDDIGKKCPKNNMVCMPSNKCSGDDFDVVDYPPPSDISIEPYQDSKANNASEMCSKVPGVYICNDDYCYPVPCVPACTIANKCSKAPNGVLVSDGKSCHLVQDIPCGTLSYGAEEQASNECDDCSRKSYCDDARVEKDACSASCSSSEESMHSGISSITVDSNPCPGPITAGVYICSKDNCYPVPCVPYCAMPNTCPKLASGVYLSDGDKLQPVPCIPSCSPGCKRCPQTKVVSDDEKCCVVPDDTCCKEEETEKRIWPEIFYYKRRAEMVPRCNDGC